MINLLIITIGIISVGCSNTVPNYNKQENNYNRTNNASKIAIEELDRETKNMKTTVVGN